MTSDGTVDVSDSGTAVEGLEESISGLSGDLSSGVAGVALDEPNLAELEARLRLAPGSALGGAVGGGAVPRLSSPESPLRRKPGRAGPVAARGLVEEHRNVARSTGKRPAISTERTEHERQIFHHAEVEAAQSRRLLSLEETVMLRDRKIAELQAQVEALRDRKSDLARKMDFEQDVREQVEAEIARFQGKAQVDLQTVRSNLQALHNKEMAVLKDRLKESEAKVLALQKRLDGEEQAHQALQLAHFLACELKCEKVHKDYRLLLQDCEAHKRRATLLEDTLALRDERVAELQSKVESLREKKKDLARRVEMEQVSSTQEVREQINAEIRRLQEKAQADLENVRSNMTALHQKEVSLLQDRVQAAEERLSGVQTRLDNEEQAHQAHQLSFSRVRAELQNEITELTGSLKLKTFELERAGFTMDEVSRSRQRLETENTQLKKQMEVMRQEFYNLELQYNEGRATERAELMTLREQMKGYLELEKDLDATIKNCAEAPTADAQEALLIGTTLGSAPASAQRRIQQSLLLAQELQRKNREAREASMKLEEAEEENSRLRQDLEAARMESRAAQCSEPQVQDENSSHNRPTQRKAFPNSPSATMGTMRRWPWLALVVEVLGDGGMSCEGAEPHIHVASLVSELATSMSAFMATAMWNLGQVTLLDDGKGSTWPPSKKLPIYRKYLHSLPDVWLCDFILLIDSFDALILEPEEKLIEIVTGMEQRTGSFAFFGAETWCKTNCSEQDLVAEEHQVKTPYRYLNSGLHIGRLWAMRQFFDEHMDMSTVWAVQDWCINVTLAIPGIAVLDYKQELFMNAFGVEGIWDGQEARDNNQPEGSIAYVKDEISGKQWVENRITHTRPPILHFPGPGKFPKYFPCFEHPELNCQQSIPFELVRRFMPTAYKGWRLNKMHLDRV
eukprot:s1300_g4.t1